ncbi:MAG TPA: FAD-binding oxidoreductase [Steroidobacteraceae bacterium]
MGAPTAEALEQIVGAAHVCAATEADAVDGVQPRWVVEPGSASETAGVLRFAMGTGLRVVARGGGTKLSWGNPPASVDVVLSTRRLNGVLEHAHGDMTATVQAGCTVAAFNQRLAERGQRLALDPLWPGQATIGGILATNDSGAHRATFGTLRDHLIGITVVLADGTIARSGGRVVKNVAGYDLPKLFTGSWGTLGIIVEATFRLYPIARAAQSVRFEVSSMPKLGAVLAAIAEQSNATTAVQIEAGSEGPPTVLVLVEGLPEAIEEKVRRVTQAVGCPLAAVGNDAWTAGEQLFADADTWVMRVGLLQTQWPAVCERIAELARSVRWRIVAQAVGVGLLSVAGNEARVREAVEAIRKALKGMGGTLTMLRCPRAAKQSVEVWPDVGDALSLMWRVKEQFDPAGTLSPGRFVGGI